ncbi:MAG: DM13 domain-containing protein [Phycisphaerae bacterium]|nr:DM13 domain-containing protein [Phycisphaerae bacterium]
MRYAVTAVVMLFAVPAARGDTPYARAGWFADLSTLAHGVSGRVTIVDADTFRIDDFFYDGGGISVYAYLGASDSNAAFASGLQTGPQLLGMPFSGGSLVIDLPAGQTLDGYNAVSIWCVTAGANFGSGTFGPPEYPRAGYQVTLPPGSHSTHGVVTIVDERTLRLDEFFYDGFAPAVYVNLGVDTSNASFLNGTWIGPQFANGVALVDATFTVQFPPGQTLDGFGAVCIWCEVIKACFTRGSFPRATGDIDIDGDVDLNDYAMRHDCTLGPDIPGQSTRDCIDADVNGDGFVDLGDFADADLCRSGRGQRPATQCIE